jgi:hypothetical protein
MSRLSSASLSVNDWLSRMAFSASALLRPRLATILRREAAASFSIFCFMTASISPVISTGCAAPVLVPGAMAATSPASRMKKPAEAARAPLGATYVTTGMGAATIFSMDSRMASMRPPGVFRRTSSNAASSCLACWMARDRISAVTGWIIPSTSTASTRGAAALELAAASASKSRLANRDRTITLIYLG